MTEDEGTASQTCGDGPGETSAQAGKARPERRSGSRVIPGLMLLLSYGFAYRAWQMLGSGVYSSGYSYMVILTGVPFLLAAHGFALVRWSQLRTLKEVKGTIRDVTTDASLSAWEIFFCWLGISASLMFLYYAAPVTEFEQWYPRFFLVLAVFFAATYQKALVFVYALLPFVITLTALSLYVFGTANGGPLAHPDSAAAVCFLAMDVAVLLWAAKITRNYGGFQVSEFQMPMGAAFAGGFLGGVVRTRQDSMPEGGFQLHLSCLQQYKGATKRQGQVLWHVEKTVRGDAPGGYFPDATIPVSFAIPAEAAATSTRDENNRVTWTLRATAALPETDFSCWFEVPVRRTEGAALQQQPVHLLHAQGMQSPDTGFPMWTDGRGGTKFAFKAGWNRATELVTIAYFLFWVQLVWLATSYRVAWETWGIFGAGMCFSGWAMLPWTFRTDVVVTNRTARVVNRWLFLWWTRVVRLEEIRDVVVKASRLRTGLTEGLDFYRVELILGNGKVVAARHLRDRAVARGVASKFREFAASIAR